jgi:hypothetical protein
MGIFDKRYAEIAAGITAGVKALVDKYGLPEKEAQEEFARAMTAILAETAGDKKEEMMAKFIEKGDELGYDIRPRE